MKKQINENFLLDAMGTVLVGAVGLLGTYYGGIAAFEVAADAKDKLNRRYKEIKQGRLDKKLEPILRRFAEDPTVQDMYKSLPKYRDPFNAPTDEQAKEQEKLNQQHIEQAKKISDYIESQLSPKELKYIGDITAGLSNKMNETKMNKIEKLRSLIRESIQDYIKEIDGAAEDAAMEARINKCEEAIQMRETKLNNLKNLEEAADMLDETKVRAIENEIKELKKAKVKFEKAKEKKANKKSKKKEVVSDTEVEAPVDEADVMAEMDTTDEVAINESFLKMQKLAGLIK